jgi:predicted RNase H-like HicB family nuclease
MRQVILIPDETGGYVVEVPSLPGCRSQGDTKEEALANIQDAIQLYIEDLIEHNEHVPDDIPAPIILGVVNDGFTSS